MKYKKFLNHLYLCFLFINLEIFNCKEKNEYEKNANVFINDIIPPDLSPDLSSHNDNNLNAQINFNSYPEKVTQMIEPGEVRTILLFIENIFNFKFNSKNYNKENDLMVNFYPLDCKIQIIEEKDNNALKIETITNFEYDAFSALIEKDKINSTSITIQILINSRNDYNKNRTYHLIINSFEYINNANLTIKEKEPTILSFNNKIDKIHLLYDLTKKEYFIYPISISFFIKERVKFKITVSSGENEPLNKIVGYKDIILIDKDFIPNNSAYIDISIENIEKEKHAVIITKVLGEYKSPIYFQKNQLNIGFIPSNISYQYYYMEVFEGESGEIMLNNKRYNGMLFSKLIPKNDINEIDIFNSSEFYPKKENENNSSLSDNYYLEFNEIFQKISFHYNNTNLCTDGCYLLITYFSIYFNKSNNSNIKGTEFTLLGRIFDEEEEFKTQIINIPLNEYIFGSLEFTSIKIHYYTLYIPEKEKNIKLEINLYNIAIFAKKGIKKINYYTIKPLCLEFTGYFIYNITPQFCELDSFEGQYITFALSTYLPLENSYYYFRILQENSRSNSLIYSLDTNKVNICKTNNYSCFFLIDNIFNDLDNNLIIYANGKGNINYTAWFIQNNENDYYSINVENPNYAPVQVDNNYNFLKIEKIYNLNIKYILIKIQSSSEENLAVLANFYNNDIIFPPIQIYSYQLVYLNSNENFTYNFADNTYDKYRIIVNNIYGQGKIPRSTEQNNDYLIVSGNRILSLAINNETNNIHILNPSGQLLLNIKIDNELNNPVLEELQFNNNIRGVKNLLETKYYYLREIDYDGADINFYFHFNEQNKNIDQDYLIIKGYAIEYDLIKLITEQKFIKPDFGEEIKGKFDNRTNNGLIVFEKERIINNKFTSDFYYLIEIESNANLSDITMDIFATSKNGSQFSIPINKYISGSFKLANNKNKSQEYYIKEIDEENNENVSKDYTIEFSSNCECIELTFCEDIKEYKDKRKIIGGIQKFFINITYNNKNQNCIRVQTNPNYEYSHKSLKKANYIIRYSETDKEEFDFELDLQGEIKNEDDIPVLEIKNNIKKNYTFTGFFYIYEKNERYKNEILNTTAIIESTITYIDTINFSNEIFAKQKFNMSKSIIAEEYEGTAFFIVPDNKMERGKSYYSYNFNIFKQEVKNDSDKEKNKKNDTLAFILMSVLLIFIIIITIIFILTYIRIKAKNKDLENQVNSISFVDENANSNADGRGEIFIV